MTLTKKLLASYGLLVGILMVLTLSLFFVIASIDSSFRHATVIGVKKLSQVGKINAARGDMRAALRGVILSAYGQRPDMVESSLRLGEASTQQALDAVAQLQGITETAEGHAKLQKIEENFRTWNNKLHTVYEMCKQGHPVEAEAYGARETKGIAEETSAIVAQLLETQGRMIDADVETEARQAFFSKITNAAAFLLSLVAGVFVLRMVLDISHRLESVVSELSSGSEQLTSAASQISSTAQSLAQGASEQAASLQETSSSSGEIVSMTKRNAENSKEAMHRMESTSQQIVEGNQRLSDMRASMEHINGSAEKIGKIIRTIDEIAFQTNILALNAAVEAARAGEAGMGFAVVADEVRNLAQRCAQAAKDTADLIEEAIHSSHEGTDKLGKVEEAITAITQEAEKVRTLITEVSLSSEEQSRGLEQINKSVSEMEVVTQRSAAGAEESAAAGEELNSQAHTLRGIVQQLHAMVHSSGESTSISSGSSYSASSLSFTAPAVVKERPRAVKKTRAVKPAAKATPAPELESFLLGSASSSSSHDSQEWQ